MKTDLRIGFYEALKRSILMLKKHLSDFRQFSVLVKNISHNRMRGLAHMCVI